MKMRQKNLHVEDLQNVYDGVLLYYWRYCLAATHFWPITVAEKIHDASHIPHISDVISAYSNCFNFVMLMGFLVVGRGLPGTCKNKIINF